MAQHDIRDLFAQQDATALNIPTGTESNTLLAIVETAVDFTPIVGDLKALFHDAPESFRTGHPILGSIDILSAFPLLGLPFDFLRKAIRAVGRGTVAGAKASVRGLSRVLEITDNAIMKTGTGKLIDRLLPTSMSTSKTAKLADEADFDQLLGEIRADRLARGSAAGLIRGTPPPQRVIDQSEALARRRTASPQRRAIERGRPFVKRLQRAVREGRSDDARQLAREMISHDRTPLPPTR